MMRITTNATLFNYRYNLMNNTNLMNNAMTKVMTQRQFSTYATNPAAATRAFKIHSSLNAAQAQYANNQTVTSKFETAWSNIQGILDDLTDEMGKVPALKGLNGTNALEDLDSQAQVLRGAAEAIVQSMNAKYDDDYIFAGSDNRNPPFDIDDDGFITYRGIQIDNPATLGNEYLGPDGQPVPNPDSPTGANYTNEEMLKEWAENDPLYVDVGLGFALDNNGNVIESTAFDSAISGIDILGYGVDDNGNPKNLASIMLRLADVFENYDQNPDREKAEQLVDAFNTSQQAVIEKHAELDVQTGFLNTNGTQLDANFSALNEERVGLEMVDPADAITELMWAQTCYSAALQVGVNVIPQSLMDYLK